MHDSILIIVPTYNEKDNLARLVEKIWEFLPHAHILVVDDNSPDGTGRIADGIAAKDERVHVLHRQGKEGLGKAYVAGFNWALTRGYKIIQQMDCDFSHRPEHLPDFINAISNADLVLGSRYVAGGGTKNWKTTRKLISWGGNVYARTVLRLPYKDLTGGFKCWRSKVLADIGINELLTTGFCFQIETTYRAHKRGHKIVEIPILFPDRTEGESKMSGSIFKEALFGVWKLRSIKFDPKKG